MKKQGKKILIGVLITILIGGLIFVFVLNYHNQSSSINKSDLASIYPDENIMQDIENATIEEEYEEVITGNVDESNLIEEQKKNLIKQDKSTVVNKETTNNNDAHTSDKVTIMNKDNKIQDQDNKSKAQKNSNNNQITETQNTQNENKTPSISQNKNNEQNKDPDIKQEEKSEETTQEKQEDKDEVITPSIPEEPKVEDETKEEAKEEPKQENIHTYKYNAAITEQIKQDILNNESDYMKQYGYTIVIDESIVTLTNQFTYTNTRVKDKIIKKFGTIRIYARDYYYNGEYMFTECYII